MYGYPKDLAAEVAVETVRSTPTSVDRVIFVCFDQATRDLYQAQLSA